MGKKRRVMYWLKGCLLFFAALLVGCNSSTVKPSATTATIQGNQVNDGIALRNFFRIESIDRKGLSYVLKSETNTRFPISPGTHMASLYMERGKRPSTPNCPCAARVKVQFQAEANKSYRVNGKFDGYVADVWVEEIGNVANKSKPEKVSFRRLPRKIYLPMPIK